MWSLGCVYLEILVWYIDGYQALMKFRASREGHVVPHGLEDEGFYYETSSGTIELRKPVLEKIACLSKRCSGGLKDIVETIPLLLRIDPKDRLSATQLVGKLSHLGTGTSTSTGPSSTAGPIHSTPLALRAPNSSRSHKHNSSSDSDFGGIVKITRPSDG
jgi:hypothetical protein